MAETPGRKIVVIVEDTQEIAQLIKDTLNAEPEFQAVVASDSALAMEVIRSVKADLIIMDVYLPGMSGIELYDVLQDDSDMRPIPVLFVTAAHSDPKFKKRKFKHFMAKPFDLDELVTLVKKICVTDEK
jgi:DNA-binding response OmpR family regulator